MTNAILALTTTSMKTQQQIYCVHSDFHSWYYVRGSGDSGLRLLEITMLRVVVTSTA